MLVQKLSYRNQSIVLFIFFISSAALLHSADLPEFAPCTVGLWFIVGELMEFAPFIVSFLLFGSLVGSLDDKYTFEDSHRRSSGTMGIY